MLTKLKAYHNPSQVCPVCQRQSKFRFIKNHKNQYGKYSLFECSLCNVQFWSPYKNPGKEWYESTDPYNAKKGGKPRELHGYHKKFLKDNKEKISGAKILDLGCGTAEFMSELQKRGAEVWGTDLDQKAIDIAKQSFVLSNISNLPIEKFLEKKDLPKFDYITIFEVIEHIDNPLQILQMAIESLKPNGKIILSVPSRQRIFPNTSGWDYPLHHLSRWNNKSLKNILLLAGCQNIIIKYINKFYYLNELSIETLIPKKLISRTKKNLLKTENFKEKKAHGFIQKIILKPFYFVARFIAIILIPKILSCILLPATFIFYPKTGAMYTQANPKSK